MNFEAVERLYNGVVGTVKLYGSALYCIIIVTAGVLRDG